MPTYSTNLGLTLPFLNEYVNTWGDVTNDNLGSYLEQAITGYLVQPISTGTEVILTIPNGAAGAARNMYIRLDGTGGASTFLTLPTKNKLYFVHNNTAGAITVRAQGPTAGTSVAAGTKVILVYNGVDVVEATSYSPTGGATGANPTAQVGLSAVNGAATTFMRSDAAPPIDQAITPTWTGVHTFTATITAAGMNVTGVTTPANGIYLPSPNTLGFATNAGTTRGSINSTGNWVINAPTSGIGLSVNGVSGTHSTQIDDSASTAYNAGYLEVPPNSQTTNYTAVLADSGKVLVMDGSSITATIPLNSAAAYPIGTVLTFININASALSIDITATGTLYLVATTTTGTRTLAQYGIATAIKIATNTWVISGSGLS